MNNDLHITLVQTRLSWEDTDANLKWLSEKIDGIYQPSDVIILPEMFTTGFSMNTSLAESHAGRAVEWMATMAARSNAVITGSLMFKSDGRYFNRLIWMQPDGHYESYDKRHLFSIAGENQYFSAGSRRLVVIYKGWRICPMICYDLRFPVWSRNICSNGVYDYDLLIYVANWPEKRSLAWKSLLPARAIENQAYVAAVNRIGIDGNQIGYSGDSGVYNYQGEKLSRTERFGDKTETISLAADDLKKFRESFPVLTDADRFNLSLTER